MSAATSASKLRADDRDHLDARLAQQGIGIGIAVIGKDHARRGADQIGAAVPLRPLAHVARAAGLDQPHGFQAEGAANRFDQTALVLAQVERSGFIPGR